MALTIWPLFSYLRALRTVEHGHRPAIVSRAGEPSLVVLPFNESLQGWALKNTPEFLEDIDRAEAQIAQGTMTTLDDALSELGVPETDTTDFAVEVDAQLEQVITRMMILFAPGRSSLPGALGAMRLAHADFEDNQGVSFQFKQHRTRLWNLNRHSSDIEVAMRGFDHDKTKVLVKYWGHDAALETAYRTALKGALGELKQQLEEPPESFSLPS